jgi:tripartite-type tricarboxylate transporter receptor subunit TctC
MTAGTVQYAALLAAFALASQGWAQGQRCAQRPIRLVVGFPPGGAADLVARAMGQRVTEQWRRQVIVDNRSSAVPELPTIAESGFPGFEVVPWFGLVAPAKTPAAIIDRWNAVAVQMYREQDFEERFRRQALEPSTTSPQEFAAFMRAEIAMWSKVFKDVGTSLQ